MRPDARRKSKIRPLGLSAVHHMGLKAREASYWDTGTTVSLEGRIQSRRYIKLIGGEPVEKTAFEVSVTEIEELT